jgi:hypothetical protein
MRLFIRGVFPERGARLASELILKPIPVEGKAARWTPIAFRAIVPQAEQRVVESNRRRAQAKARSALRDQ